MSLSDQIVKLYPKLKIYARFKTGNEHDAEDLVMDVITKSLEKADAMSKVENLESYLITSIRNRHLDFLRKRSKIKLETELSTDEGSFFDSIADQNLGDTPSDPILKKRLAKALVSVGEECKEILLLFSIGNSYIDLTEALGVPIGTIKSKMSRCRGSLSGFLGNVE